VVIPNFVASALADRPSVPVGGLPQEPFALFAGAAAPHKGLDVLLEAWKPPAPCPLVIATIQPLNRSLPPDVTQTSFSRDELVSVLRSAALTVVPSLWPDPCPTIVIEAMTLGVPIVASHIGGIKELVTDGLEGRLVSPNDPGALRQAVTQLLASPSLREGMAAAGRRRSATYSLKALATSIELLYTEAIREADAIGDADA